MNPFLLPQGFTYHRRSRKPFVAATAAALVLAAGGAGYAAWSATATGTSQAASATAVTASVDVVVGSADLYPGASGAVHFTVTNPNAYPVVFTAADLSAVVTDDEALCPSSNITVADKSALSIPVPANTTSAPLSLPAAVSMLSTAPDGCQGRTFVVTTTLTGSSA